MDREKSFSINTHRAGKRLIAETRVKKFGGVLICPDGTFRWDGGHWVRVQESFNVRLKNEY